MSDSSDLPDQPKERPMKKASIKIDAEKMELIEAAARTQGCSGDVSGWVYAVALALLNHRVVRPGENPAAHGDHSVAICWCGAGPKAVS